MERDDGDGGRDLAAGLQQNGPVDIRHDRADGAGRNRDPFGYSKFSVKFAVWGMKAFLLLTVTSCLVLSKLTIIETFAKFNKLVNVSLPEDEMKLPLTASLREVAGLYWQLLLIMMIPSFLTWISSVFKGISSSSWNHPWPKKSAIALGISIASLEALAESLLCFLVFMSLPPEAVIFLMTGLFSIQGILNVLSFCNIGVRHRAGYEQLANGNYDPNLQMEKWKKMFLVILSLLGVLLQFGIVIVVILVRDQKILLIVMIACLLILSIVWTNKLQKLTFRPSQAFIDKPRKSAAMLVGIKTSARWKASFIAATVRLLLYPVFSYCIARYFYHLKDDPSAVVDPWCFHYITNLRINEAFSWDAHDSAVFGVHIVSSFLAYVVQGVSCYMTLHAFGLALPVFLATPISIGIYFFSNSPLSIRHLNLYLFPFTDSESTTLDWKNTITSQDPHLYILILVFAILVWFGQLLITGYNLFKSKNAILASEDNMFVRPYYNSVFLEQFLAINRCVTGNGNVQGAREPSKVFICSTMYRENLTEMRQLLQSLYRVAKYSKINRHDTFESHIFFDDGYRGDDPSQFAVQLMSLVPAAMRVELAKGMKQETPYGYRFSWEICGCMPFVIHLKDSEKFKNKKRWSQVMYMNYVLNYRMATDNLDPSKTFILTTDADIDFKAEAAVVLLDMLARDSTVGAVCARTHPLGFGLMYWYQVFDYAIGHWLQKSAEHILGSVLCCPGCFSMFRCSALKDCLDEYSSEVDNAIEFLMKDMGEDRWLCTLLVEKGWRLEYCAISKNYTYCPVEFDEFFKQRRRWIPSTVANLWLLVSQGKKMTSSNDSIGWLFIIYQLFLIFSTIITPGTVILLITSGLQVYYNIDAIGVIVPLLIVAVGYGLVCLYASQQTQLDIAKLLTFLSSLLMTVVITGVLTKVIGNLIQSVEDSEGSGAEEIQDIHIGETAVYLSIFTFVFAVTAILHYKEFFSLLYSLWYLLALPSGYILLIIYSTANLNNRSWGTREKPSNDAQGLMGTIWEWMKTGFKKCLSKRNKTAKLLKDAETLSEDEPDQLHCDYSVGDLEGRHRHYPWIMAWLRKYDCEKFYDCFVNEGYTEEWYLAGMSEQDLRDIGVKPEGYVRRLIKPIKKLPVSNHVGIPKTVEQWIEELRMGVEEDDYVKKFQNAGYSGEHDVANLPFITKEELQRDVGVRKKGHINRFLQGLRNIKIHRLDEEKMNDARVALQPTNDQEQEVLQDRELAFWLELGDIVLYPMPDSLSNTNSLKDELKYLRNSVLIALLLINLIWIMLLYLLVIEKLGDIGLNKKYLSLLFLVVYGLILIIQFVAMLFHRTVTLSHYISRLSQSLPVEQTVELVETANFTERIN